MKFEVRCELESDIILPRRLELKTETRTLSFEVDERGRWDLISIVAEVADPSRVRWGLEPVPETGRQNQAPAKVVGELDPELYDSIINDLQCVESTLSVFLPLRNINWHYPTLNIIFEDGDPVDPKWGDLRDFRVSRQKPAPTEVEEGAFVSMVGLALKSHSLVAVESFWREGENEWVSGRFINAFFNYYFILEGLYGKRKTKNSHIEKEFLASPELKTSIDKFLADQHPQRHIEQVASLLKITDRMPTAEDFIRLLVSIRGRLHHFQNNPNRAEGSPLEHSEYEGISALARYVAHKGIVSEALKIKPLKFAPRKS